MLKADFGMSALDVSAIGKKTPVTRWRRFEEAFTRYLTPLSNFGNSGSIENKRKFGKTKFGKRPWCRTCRIAKKVMESTVPELPKLKTPLPERERGISTDDDIPPWEIIL